MAITSDGFEGYVTLMDTNGDTSTLRFDLIETDPEEALEDLQTIVSRLDAVTTAVVKGYTLAHKFSEKAITFPANSHVERRAVVVARLAGSDPSKTTTFAIPSPDPGIFMDTVGEGSKIVDVQDAALQTYISTWRPAANGGMAQVSDGEHVVPDATAILRGRLTHRQSSYG